MRVKFRDVLKISPTIKAMPAKIKLIFYFFYNNRNLVIIKLTFYVKFYIIYT